jgi:hypothetical protein
MPQRKGVREASQWRIDEVVVGKPADGDRAMDTAMRIIARWALHEQKAGVRKASGGSSR